MADDNKTISITVIRTRFVKNNTIVSAVSTTECLLFTFYPFSVESQFVFCNQCYVKFTFVLILRKPHSYDRMSSLVQN